MKVFLLGLLLVSAASAARPGARIIGGRPSNAGEFPFSAAITSQTPLGQYFCGGTLINNLHVATSASCVDGSTLFSIRLGIDDLTQSGGDRISADKYIIHPKYSLSTLDSDIGIIVLRLPVLLSDYIQPIALPTRDVQPYAVVSAIGWGQISDSDAGLINRLQTVVLTALSNDECKLSFGNQITDNMVCVDGNYNQGTCLGDTGGPLIQYVNGHQATLVGISSFLSGNGCESTDPSGFTRIFPYLDWIRDNTAT